ncbi:DUF2027 domain-containing protein [Puteibacter caeruleilacunae]|nr:DUF2027 domain-containing protein [Puteibacter caeruleilacunae]
MIKVGDKVRFLDDVGGGYVTSIISKTMINVENEDGFEIPVLVSNVVKIESEEFYSSEDKHDRRNEVDMSSQAQPEPEPEKEEPEVVETVIIKGNDEPKFFYTIVPDNKQHPVEGALKAYLVNDSNFTVLFHMSYLKNGNYETIESGTLEPNVKLLVDSFAQIDLADFPTIYFQLIYFQGNDRALHAPIQKEIAINPVRFYKQKSFKENDYFHNPAIVYSLLENPMLEDLGKMTDKDFKNLVREKQEGSKKKEKKEKRQRTKDIVEIDLHIHELIDDESGLSNREILDIQMEHFQREMEDAIKGGVKRIVFIHGVGNGRLKQEVRQKLASGKYKKYGFQDASFKEYGFGATMVVLRRN